MTQGRPKLRQNRAGHKPGERQYNAAPGMARPVKSAGSKAPGPNAKPNKGFTKARGRDEDEGPTPIDPVPWETPGVMAETPRAKKSRGTTSKSKPSKLGESGAKAGEGQAKAKPSEARGHDEGKRFESRGQGDKGSKAERADKEPRAPKAERADKAPRAPKAERAERPAKAPKAMVIRTGSGTDLVTVKLARGKSKPFWVGHPWVFSGAIASVDGELGQFGAPCIVEDERDNALGFGHYNPDGAIAVRLLTHRRTTDLPFAVPDLSALLDTRLAAAIALRTTLGLPGGDTDVYRLVNAEGDFLPGLVVDRLGDVTSIQI
ncbi:MAG TPA: hypothetical protein PK095_15080, partial [Myxococcota bacterium]|nr:hypothetical protein [Myxococcota bacterium]